MTEKMDLAVFDPIVALTVKVQEEDAALELDHTTEEGEKELRSWVHTVRGYRAGLEKIRVRAKADSLEYGKAVDKKAKELKTPFDTIIDARMKPLDDIEDAKRAKAEAIVEAERVAEEKAETDRIAELKRREAVVAEKEAEIKAAEDAKQAEIKEAAAVKAALEQGERDKIAARDEAERQRIATLAKVEQDKKDALALAECTKQVAIGDARAAAARKDRIERDRLAIIARDLKLKEAAEPKRVADTAHRSKIHRAIEEFLRDYVLDAEASIITEEIVAGNVPNVTINY